MAIVLVDPLFPKIPFKLPGDPTPNLRHYETQTTDLENGVNGILGSRIRGVRTFVLRRHTDLLRSKSEEGRVETRSHGYTVLNAS